MFLSFVGELGLFGVFEDSFLPVDGSFDHSFGFVNLDQVVVLEFGEAVVDFAVG